MPKKSNSHAQFRNDINMDGHPELRIIIQPKNTFRFRYRSEKGSHGGLGGVGKGKKIYPKVKLENCFYDKEVVVCVSLYTIDDEPQEHVLDLVATDSDVSDGKYYQKLDDDYTAQFPNIQIYVKKKEEIERLLKERHKKRKQRISSQKLNDEIARERKNINMHSLRLCFEAFFADDLLNPICPKVFSDAINDIKDTGDLCITRISKYVGSCSGKEDIILLCSKVKKDDIEVHFYESDDEAGENPIGLGVFTASDVHYQYAIAFQTPEYKNLMSEQKNVKIVLYRPSENKFGNTVDFVFIEDEYNSRKRKRPNPSQDVSNIASTSSENSDSTSSVLLTPETTSNNNWDYNLYNSFKSSDDFLLDLPADFMESDLDSLLEQGTLFQIPVVNETNNAALESHPTGCNILQSSYFDTCSEVVCDAAKVDNPFKREGINKPTKKANSMDSFKHINKNSLCKYNSFKETALHIATARNEWRRLQFFLLKGGDPFMLDANGESCFHIAACHNHHESMSELLRFACSNKLIPGISKLNYDGYSPLHLCILNNSKRCLSLLLQSNVDVNFSEGRCGRHPLHLAVEHQPSLVSLIMAQSNVDVLAQDFGGITPLQIVCDTKNLPYEDVVSDLEEKDGDFFENCIQFINTLYKEECCEELEIENTVPVNTNDEALLEGVQKLKISPYVDSSSDTETSLKEKDHVTSCSKKHENIDEKLCKALDFQDNWKTVALYSGIDDNNIWQMANDYKECSPGSMILNILKKKDENYMELLQNILSYAKESAPSLNSAWQLIENVKMS